MKKKSRKKSFGMDCMELLQMIIKKKHNHSMSLEKIRMELSHIQSSILEDPKTGNLYKLPSPLSDEAKTLYQILKIRRSKKAKAL